MKKLLLTSLLSLGILSFAQKRERKEISPEKRIEKQAEKLTADLSLSEDQKAKVIVALNERKESLPERKELTSEEKKELRKKMKAEQQTLKQKMKGILSEEQYKKWEAIMAEKKEKMKDKIKENKSE